MGVLGIDFGTSNTVGMIRAGDGRVRPLLFDGSPLLLSAVYLGADGRVLVGRDAERNARLDPSRFEPNPKRRIDDGQIFLGGRELSVVSVFGEVLGRVAEEARRQLGDAPTDVRLTHPARWGERRRSLLVEAARLAGLPTPRLIPEPVGAASYFTAILRAAVPVGRSLAVYDLGGGTFDATVVRRTPAGFEVLAEEGLADVGGTDFDHAIVEHLGRTHGVSHPQRWERLMNPVDQGDRRQRWLLYEDVRGVKEMLSRTASADIPLPTLEVDAHVTREDLERLVRGPLERTVGCLRQAIVAARLEPRDLVGIFLVGGSSRIPMAAQLLASELGVAPTTLEQPETVVVEGAMCLGAPAPARVRPVSTPPAALPQGPRPAARGPVVSMMPVSRPVPQVAPPVQPPRPVPQMQPMQPMRRGPGGGVPQRPMGFAQRPVPVAPPGVGGQQRRRYTDPAVVATIVVLVLIAVVFVVLLKTALSG